MMKGEESGNNESIFLAPLAAPTFFLFALTFTLHTSGTHILLSLLLVLFRLLRLFLLE